MKWYSAINKSEIMKFPSKQMELDIAILSELIQTQKDKRHRFSPICEC